MIAYNFPKQAKIAKELVEAMRRGGGGRGSKTDLHHMFPAELMDWNEMDDQGLIAFDRRSKTHRHQFFCFLLFTFSLTWYVLYELSHVVKIKMYNN